MMKILQNRKLLLTTVTLALTASVVVGRERPSSLQAVEPASRIDTRVEIGDELDLAKLAERVQAEGAQANPFASLSFAPPGPPAAPAVAAAPQRAPKPEAPALPFTYLGKVIDEGKLSVFLARGEESLSVRAGDRIGDDYRVDRVTESEIFFTYLPMKAKQSMPL